MAVKDGGQALPILWSSPLDRCLSSSKDLLCLEDAGLHLPPCLCEPQSHPCFLVGVRLLPMCLKTKCCAVSSAGVRATLISNVNFLWLWLRAPHGRSFCCIFWRRL